MRIARNSVVTLDYHVIDSDQEVVDEGREPLVYLHGGYGGIFDRIEEELQGKAKGDTVKIKLEPDDAFGEYDAELVTIEPRKLFPENIAVGMQFERGDNEGDMDEGIFFITDITDDKVVIDGNHPLAGMALIFTCTVTAIRPASAEEIEHGHVHSSDEDEDGCQ